MKKDTDYLEKVINAKPGKIMKPSLSNERIPFDILEDLFQEKDETSEFQSYTYTFVSKKQKK